MKSELVKRVLQWSGTVNDVNCRIETVSRSTSVLFAAVVYYNVSTAHSLFYEPCLTSTKRSLAVSNQHASSVIKH